MYEKLAPDEFVKKSPKPFFIKINKFIHYVYRRAKVAQKFWLLQQFSKNCPK
jgi:hypothetical protein